MAMTMPMSSSSSAVYRRVHGHGRRNEFSIILSLLILIVPNFLPTSATPTSDDRNQAKDVFSKDIQTKYIFKMSETYEDPVDALRILRQELFDWNLVENNLLTVTLPLTSTSNESADVKTIKHTILGKFSSLGINLTKQTSDAIAMIGSRTRKAVPRTKIVAIRMIKDLILDEITWYEFLQQTTTLLSSFDIQKERSKYNSPNLKNWGQGSNSSGGSQLKQVKDLQLFVKKLTQTFPNTFFPSAANLTRALTLNPKIQDFKLSDMNRLLQTLLNDPLNCLYDPWTNTVEVSGNFILLSQIVRNSTCLRVGTHTLIIHAKDTFFVDTDILGHTINATHNLNIMAFAPRWTTIGTPTINLSGKDGQPWDGPAPNGTNGQPGHPGGNAGNFVGTALVFEGNVPNFLVNASKGGPGQDGGDAGDGGMGALGGTSGSVVLTQLGRVLLKVGLEKGEIVEVGRAGNGRGGIGGKNGTNTAGLENPPRQISLSSLELTQLFKTHLTRHVAVLIEKDASIDYASEWYQNGTKFEKRQTQANITALDKFRHPLSMLQQLYNSSDLLTWADLGNLTFVKNNKLTPILDSNVEQLLGELKFSLPSRKLEISRQIERIWDFSHLTLKQRLNPPQKMSFPGLFAIKNVTLSSLKNGALWSDFLTQVYLGLSSYGIQKNRQLYNVGDLSNWGKNGTRSSPADENIQIRESAIPKFVEVVAETLQFSKIRFDHKLVLQDMQISGIEANIRRLNQILSFLLHDKMTCKNTTQKSGDETTSTVIVRGNFVLLSQVMEPSCLPPGTNSLVIFALDTIFLDTNITGWWVNPETNLDIFIFSPKWVTIERDLVFDLNGRPRFQSADLTSFQNDLNPKEKLKDWLNERKEFLGTNSDLNGLDAQVDELNSTDQAIQFLKNHTDDLKFFKSLNKSTQVGVKANPGKSGLPGRPAGNFFGLGSTLEGVTLSFPQIKVDGGVGGPGQPGQEGANGTDGWQSKYDLREKNYKDEDEVLAELNGAGNAKFKCKKGPGYNMDTRQYTIIIECEGTLGSSGSDGGIGGVGGKGGAMGKVILAGFDNSNQTNNLADGNHDDHVGDLKAWTGSAGADGQGGSGGKGGHGGMKDQSGNFTCEMHVYPRFRGTYHLMYCSSDWTIKEKTWLANGTDGESAKSIEPARQHWEFQNRSLQYLDIYRQLALPQVANNKDNIGGNLLGQFLTELDTNPGLPRVQDRLASFYDFQGLELALNKIKRSHPDFLDIRPFYTRLLARIYQEAENTSNNTAIKISPQGYRLALYNLYTAVYGRILAIQQGSLSQAPALVVHIQNYMKYVRSQLDTLEKARQDQLKVDFIQAENQKYRAELESRIDEARNAVANILNPELEKLQTSIQNRSVALSKEILKNIDAAEKDVKKKAEQVAKLKEQKVLNIFFGTISMVGDAVKLLGPEGAIVGAAVKTGSDIAQAVTDPCGEGAMPIFTKIPEAFANFKSPLTEKFKKDTEKAHDDFKYAMGNASKILNPTTDDTDDEEKEDPDYLEIKKYREGIQDKINQEEERIKKIVEDRKDIADSDVAAYFESDRAKEEIENSKKALMADLEKEQELIKTKLTKDKSIKFNEDMTKFMERADKASTVLGLGLAIATKADKDQQAIDTANGELTKSEQNFAAGVKLYEEVQSTFRPFLANLQRDLADQASSSSNKTSVGLEISRWQIQTTLTKIKGLLQKYTAGLKAGEELKAAFDGLDSGLTSVINIYDKIQGFLDQSRLANYISAINSVSFQKMQTGNEELDRAVTNLKALSQAQLVQQKFGEALNSFKMWIFPYALKFLPQLLTLNNFPTIQFINTTSNPLDFDEASASLNATANAESIVQLTIDSVRTRLGSIDTSIEDWKNRIDKIDQKLNRGEFYNFKTMRPFFIWTSGVNLESEVILRLLRRSAVLLKADILNRPVQFNAIKFNQIELQFVIPASPHLSEKKRQSLLQKLSNYLLTYEMLLTHSGQSVYGYNGSYYAMSTDSITFQYRFERDVHGNPVSVNGAVDKVGAGDVSLSPYTMWQVRLRDPLAICRRINTTNITGGIPTPMMFSRSDYANLNCSSLTPVERTTEATESGEGKEAEISDAELEEISRWVTIQLVGNGTYISHLDSDPASELQLDEFYVRDDSLTS